MRRIARIGMCAMIALGCAPQLLAQEWTALTGPQIERSLADKTVDYDAAWQVFRPSGKTLYNAGKDSWGNWRVQDAQYCSQWPPGELWDCYGVAQRGDQIRFIGAHGDITTGTFRK